MLQLLKIPFKPSPPLHLFCPIRNPGPLIVGPLLATQTTALFSHIHIQSNFRRWDSLVKHRHVLQVEKTLKDLCYAGKMSEAVALLWQMGLRLEHDTYALLLQQCILANQYMIGKRIHAQMVVIGYVANEYLKTKLLILYAKSGDLKTAQVFFDNLIDKSLISWNAMIAGYVQKGLSEIGLSLYYEMRRNGLVPDQYTFASTFRASAALATLEHGRQAHAVMIKCHLSENIIVNSALIDMYFKCCNLTDGHKVFSKSVNRNAITWTSLISGYGQHGRVGEVLESFRRMKEEGFRPDYVTFLAVLSACSHGGLVDEGWNYFLSMKRDYGIEPKWKHYVSMVDLLGRAGRLQEAYEFVLSAPCKEQPVIWGALIGACRIHGNTDLVKLAARKYLELDPKNAGKYVALANAYATLGSWETAAKVRGVIRSSGIVKETAYSSIEVQGKIHRFQTADESSRKHDDVCSLLVRLNCVLVDAAYVPDASD